jgi:siderophore synthetase component
LVFTPHAENVLVILERQVPVGIFIKDLAEDIGIINPETAVPEPVKHIALHVPDDWVTLCVFTDSFDGVFRFVARLLWQHLGFAPAAFWRLVAEEVADYQRCHPERSERYRRWDLWAPTFARNCLNRLQLANPDEMVDLNAPDPAVSLQFRGSLSNPIHGILERDAKRPLS